MWRRKARALYVFMFSITEFIAAPKKRLVAKKAACLPKCISSEMNRPRIRSGILVSKRYGD